jgi:hypothetical protein
MDREVNREVASNRARTSLIRKGMRQAKKEKNYEKALGFANALEAEGKPFGMTGSAEDVSSIAQGRVASREALSNQMRSQMGALTGRTREDNIAAAKAAGTFDATRAKFNEANKGKKVMDDMGNIADAPVTPPVETTTTPAAGTASTPPAGTTPPKPEVAVVPAKSAATPEALSPRMKLADALNKGRITVGDDEEARRLVEMSSDGTPVAPDKKREKRERLLAKGRAMASPLTRNRPGLPTYQTA